MEKIFFENWESMWRTLIVGVLAYLSLIVMLRISGKRTLSQMKEFDFIVTVALGSTLATVLLNKDVTLFDGILGLGLLISLQYVLAVCSVRSKKFSKIISSEPSLLFYKGNFLNSALIRERVTEAEVQSAIRSQNINSLDNVEAVVMESNGKISVVAKSTGTTSRSSLCDVSL